MQVLYHSVEGTWAMAQLCICRALGTNLMQTPGGWLLKTVLLAVRCWLWLREATSGKLPSHLLASAWGIITARKFVLNEYK